jgi:predicted dehydrogenase
VRVGVVGAGLVAQIVHLPLLEELTGLFQLQGVADPDAARRAQVAERHAAPAWSDLASMRAAGPLDAVVVSAPDAAHAGIVVEALDAGLHVLVEKPLCLTVEEADSVIAARDAAGRVVQVGYMKRFDPAHEALVADLEAARPEILHVATLTYDPGLAPSFAPPGLRGGAPQPDLRGAFTGALVHDVNLVHGLLDAAGISAGHRVVDAWGRDDGSIAGATVAIGDHVRWTMAWLHLPGVGDFRERVEVFQRAGVRSLEFPAPYLRRCPVVYRSSHGDHGANRVTERRSWADGYERQLRHFHACITSGEPCRTPPEQARRDVALLAELHDVAAAVLA